MLDRGYVQGAKYLATFTRKGLAPCKARVPRTCIVPRAHRLLHVRSLITTRIKAPATLTIGNVASQYKRMRLDSYSCREVVSILLSPLDCGLCNVSIPSIYRFDHLLTSLMRLFENSLEHAHVRLQDSTLFTLRLCLPLLQSHNDSHFLSHLYTHLWFQTSCLSLHFLSY
jgi:hypothetical protein